MLEIRKFRHRNGRVPFDDWMHTLRDIRAKARIAQRLMRLAEGNPGDWKSLGGGICELRVDVGKGYRVYFAKDGDQLVILLCGGNKASQQKDIVKAIHYWAEYHEHR